MAKFSERRIKLVYRLCILTGLLTTVWGQTTFLIVMTNLAAILCISSITYLCSLALCNDQHLNFARHIYMITFIWNEWICIQTIRA